MYILTFVMILPVIKTQYVTPLKKCCDADSYLKKVNSNFTCHKDEDKRLQIFTKHTNFLKESVVSAEDYCYDGNTNITKYKIRNQTVVEETPIDFNYYSKCCPLNFYYNSVTHSCAWSNNTDDGFITQNFVRVGLPHCRVIVDYKLNSDRYDYRLELGILHVGNETRFQEGQFCIDKDENNSLIARGCFEDLNVCRGTRCIHKCCPDGQSFVNGKNCTNTYKHGLDLSFSDRINSSQDNFAVIHKLDCRMYILKDKILYYLDPNGVFWAFYNKTNSYKKYEIDDKSYCIEHHKNTTTKRERFMFFMCFADKPIQWKFVAARWAKILSCVCIVLTAAIYLFLPELLNLFGKILMSYCTAMLAVYILLTYTQFITDHGNERCVAIGFLTLFSSLSTFSWLNVMCFDIWWTFGTPKSFLTAKQKKSEAKKFILYSLYGWVLPANLTVITYLASIFDTPYAIRPYIGMYKCYWDQRSDNYAMFLYYVTPLILMETLNVYLFTRTLIYCLKVKGEINKMNDNRISVKERKKSFTSDKEQLFLILKLSITMGMSFVFEVISSLYVFSQNNVMMYIEIVWDTVNCLQGVFIFIIFICKSKVLRLCRNKILGSKIRKISLSSLPTASTQVSTPLTSTSKIRNV